MNANELTVSLELAQELDKRGVRFGSYFCWSTQTYDGEPNVTAGWCLKNKSPFDIEAPTAGELMAVLPNEIKRGGGSSATLKIMATDPVQVWYEDEWGDTLTAKDTRLSLGAMCGDTPQDACAKMLIWLIDNGHLTVNEKGEVVG